MADDGRFAELYALCCPPIWQYCSRRVAADAVDDAVADTFLTVRRRLGFFEVPPLKVFAFAKGVFAHTRHRFE